MEEEEVEVEARSSIEGAQVNVYLLKKDITYGQSQRMYTLNVHAFKVTSI